MFTKYALSVTFASLVLSSLSGAADQFPADNDFVRNAEQAANQEVADARVALKMSHHSDVRNVAQIMQRDGTTANRRLTTLAVEKGWPSPTLDMPDTPSDYSDHRYVTRQIRAQQDAIAFYKEEAANGADTDLQAFARETLRTLQHSLIALQTLRSS
jgi:predicted outer membrane protein